MLTERVMPLSHPSMLLLGWMLTLLLVLMIFIWERKKERRRALNPKENQAEKDAEKMVWKANKDIISSKGNEVDKNDGSSSSSKPS